MINLPDAINIHVETNDINSNNSSDREIANEILKIAGSCKVAGLNEVFISSILVKKNPWLTGVIGRVNDLLRDLCIGNELRFVDHDSISPEYLWEDGFQLQGIGKYISSKHFCKDIKNAFLLVVIKTTVRQLTRKLNSDELI